MYCITVHKNWFDLWKDLSGQSLYKTQQRGFFAHPVAHLINLSIKQGRTPFTWKCAMVTPLPFQVFSNFDGSRLCGSLFLGLEKSLWLSKSYFGYVTSVCPMAQSDGCLSNMHNRLCRLETQWNFASAVQLEYCKVPFLDRICSVSR